MIREDLTEKHFGKLTVIEYVCRDKYGDSKWRCKCDCGNEVMVLGNNLKRGNTTSCGCSRILDLIGKRFGMLTVLKYAGSNRSGKALWVCECDCGNHVTVRGDEIKNGHTVSCGCYGRARASERLKSVATTHGLSTHPLYKIWIEMRRRCDNENFTFYDRYGGRGISVCEEWNIFENFYEWSISHGYNPSLTIDREDNDGDYCPENCRWVNKTVQSNNRSNNRLFAFNNQTRTIAEWSRMLNINYSTLYGRISHNDFRDFEQYFDNFE